MFSRDPRHFSMRVVLAWACWLVILANAAVIVWLWLNGGGISSVHTVGDLWTSVGRDHRLAQCYLALMQVLLLARLPWLERLAGFDQPHRLAPSQWQGLSRCWCWPMWCSSRSATRPWIALPSLLRLGACSAGYPGMVAATIGTVLMIVVVVTSLVIVRRRLRYEAWYFVHLTVYAGIALAWVHQIPTGNELSANPTAATYWTALYVATAVLLVFFRLIQPLWGAFWYHLQVAEVTLEGPGVVSLRLTGRHLDRLHARAGQFFLWRFLTPGPLVVGPPVLPLRRARWTVVAPDCQELRRLHQPHRRDRAGNTGDCRRTLRHLHGRGAPPTSAWS